MYPNPLNLLNSLNLLNPLKINVIRFALIALLVVNICLYFTVHEYRSNKIYENDRFYYDRKTVLDINDFVSLYKLDLSKHNDQPRKILSKQNLLVDPKGDPVDFVIASGQIQCSVHLAVSLINKYYNPRNIYFIVKHPSHCQVVEHWDTNLICIEENAILPNNFTSKSIETIIKQNYGQNFLNDFESKYSKNAFSNIASTTINKNLNPTNPTNFKLNPKENNNANKNDTNNDANNDANNNSNQETTLDVKNDNTIMNSNNYGNKRSDWLFKQFLYLGIGLYLNGISDHYVVWESDTIPLENRRKFFTNDGKSIFYSQMNPDVYQLSRVYQDSFSKIFGFPVSTPKSDTIITSYKNEIMWSSNQMIFNKNYVMSMIRHVEIYNNIIKDSWMIYATLGYLKKLDIFTENGFSTYELYASWIRHKYQDSMHVDLQSYQNWVVDETTFNFNLCCPSVNSFKHWMNSKDLHYFSSKNSNYNCDLNRKEYGLYDWPEDFIDLIN